MQDCCHFCSNQNRGRDTPTTTMLYNPHVDEIAALSLKSICLIWGEPNKEVTPASVWGRVSQLASLSWHKEIPLKPDSSKPARHSGQSSSLQYSANRVPLSRKKLYILDFPTYVPGNLTGLQERTESSHMVAHA